MTAPAAIPLLCRDCKAELAATPDGRALYCPQSPSHPTRVVITEETREAVEARGRDWARVTNWTETKTGPVNVARSK